jgi:hypothetical protein
MSVGLNASQARARSQQDMIIFDETQAIMREVINASANGDFEAYITDGTTMTETTPTSVKIGTVNNPTIIAGQTFIINSSTIVLGTTGTNLNSIIADINDAGVPGVTATKDSGYLVINVTLEPAQTWTYEIGAGTANTALGFSTGVYSAPNPTSLDYYSAWQGTTTDRARVQQMDQVIKHFGNLGYKIERIANTDTYRTFNWALYW